MTEIASLEQRLASLLSDAAERRAQEQTQRTQAMQEEEPRRVRFEETSCAWVKDLVIPRLQALAQGLPPTGDVEHVGAGNSARLTLRSSDEYPVVASLTVSITPCARYERAAVHLQPHFIPMLAGQPAAACYECEINLQSAEPLARFLDDQFMIFAESYLRVREPDSPYQRNVLVTDPVCGMTFHPTDAVESQDHKGRRYYFCAAVCAERFRQSPEGFLKPAQGAMGAFS